MKCLVTGASGLLGRAVVERLKKDGHEVTGIGFTRSSSDIRKLDLTDFDAVDSFLQSLKPEAIVHSAAERRPDVVEKSPETSHALNVDVPLHLAKWCKAQGEACPLLINISTDYVFDGVSPPYKVDDEPNPLNAYGKSKWDGEKGIRQSGKSGRCSSLRVPVLYGRTETNSESAVNVLLDALLAPPNGETKKMDANAVRYPTCVSDIAHSLSLLCTRFGSGKIDIPPTLHFSAMEAMTKYDMCLVMARCLRAAGEEAFTDHLEPEYEVDPNAATSRPRHCKLDLSVTRQAGADVECVSFESWWREYLQEYAKAARARRQQEEERASIAAAEAREAAEAEATRRREEQEAKRKREKEEEEAVQREEEEERSKEAERRESEEHLEREEGSVSNVDESNEKQLEESGFVELQAESTDLSAQDDNRSLNQQMSPASNEDGSLSGRNATSFSARPSSPNPSFSSLQARPTPPATSGRNSPSPSILSTNALPIPGTVEEEDKVDQLMASASTSLTETGASLEKNVDPLLPSAPQATRSSTGEDNSRDEPGFFPSALVKLDGAASSLGIETTSKSVPQSKGFDADAGGNADADSDGYGHPSPRDTPATTLPFAAGYGEVQYGLDNGRPDPASQADEARSQQIDSLEAILPKSSSSMMQKERKKYTFQIRVGDPQKIGDPMTAHIVYTVRIKTDSPLFKSSNFSVLRRYSDFRWLHAALVHNNAGIFIPPVPEKVKIGRFAPDLVEARRHGLENCINKIANNAILQADEDFVLFLSSTQFQYDVKARDQIKGPVPTPEQKTIFGWSTSLTGASYKYHESDEWFEEQTVYLDHLESQLKNLVRVIGLLSQQRKEVAASISEFSHSLMMLSGSSLSRSLSTCFAGLGEVQRRMFELTDVQADSDIRDFGSVIYEYERMVGSARKAFNTRIDAWQTWQKLEEEARKVKLKHEKWKKEVQGNSHRIHDARMTSILDEVAAIDTKCLNQKREFDLIGLRCKEEMDRFEWDRIHAFEEACEIWMQGMIERNQELMAEWEQYAALLERQTGEKIGIE